MDTKLIRSCPFCGVLVIEHADKKIKDQYYLVPHVEGCFFPNKSFLLSKENVEKWNQRIN